MNSRDIIALEDAHMPPFFAKIPIVIERGDGVRVWDAEGNAYLDFTAGWGVTSIGHAHPAICAALAEQSGLIMQGPNAGLTYSPARAGLLSLLTELLPVPLTRVFFSNSGAEANDAALKLARRVTGRLGVIATHGSFHGRTLSTLSLTGQAAQRDRFAPLVPGCRFVPYDDLGALRESLDGDTAAVIVEPLQGEGGVRIPSAGYLEGVSELCRANGTLLIVDEVQTGFCRTGPMFAVSATGARPDFLTMAKGIAGGFPLGAFAVSEEVSAGLGAGDHGGTYCGNPLACAVASAVIRVLIDEGLADHVAVLGRWALGEMASWRDAVPGVVTAVRGKGLLLLLELRDDDAAARVDAECLSRRLFVRRTQGNAIRVFPALTITQAELAEGLATLRAAVAAVAPPERA